MRYLKNQIMKHLLLLPAMLLISAISVAQLYVAPTTAGTPSDSYIYVNDEVIFVEDDVNLTLNNVDPNYKASIYLRNGSQLIQGESNGANSGSGYISTYREVLDSDAYDYTFYGSPVGDIRTNPLAAAGNLNHGSRSIFSIVNDTRSKSRFLTSNHNGYYNGADLYISDRWIHTRAPGSASNWVRMYGNPVAPPGQGFIMKGVNFGSSGNDGNTPYTYDFRGRPNNGTFTLTTIPVTGGDKEEVLTGNPYPSALDLNRLFFDTRTGDPDSSDTFENSEIDAILFWDEDRDIDSHLYVDNKGGFGVWTPGTSEPDGTSPGMYTVAPFLNYDGAGNPSGGQTGAGISYPRRFAPIGQGFYFQTINSNTGGGDGSLNQVFIKNQYRRNIKEDGVNSVFRTAIPTDAETTGNTPPPNNILPQIRLYTYFGDTHFRDMLLAFSDLSTNFYDRGLDAHHPMDATFAEAYFPVKVNENGNNIEKFVIQTVPFVDGKKVPYAIELDQQTDITLQVVESINFNKIVLLYDRELDTYTQINGNSTASFTLPAGYYKDRFYLVFRNIQTSITSVGANRTPIIEEVTGNVNFFQNNREAQLEIMNPEGYDIKYTHIFDMTGKLVTTRTDLGNSTKYSISTATMADGVYLVKLVTSDNVSIDYKTIVTNK